MSAAKRGESMDDDEAWTQARNTAFIALGSNLGDRVRNLRYALGRLDEHEAVHVKAVSHVYETEPHTLDQNQQPGSYLNAVAEVETALDPHALLALCLQIERDRGRDRSAGSRWAPRTLDLDLLIFDGVSLDEPYITLPHPRMAERRFVLRPLADIAPNVEVPGPVNARVRDLLRECSDAGSVHRTSYSIFD